MHAFEAVGGAEGLAEWAKDNLTDFYKLYARLIPTEQHISGSEGDDLNVRVSFVTVPPKDKPPGA